MLLNAQGWTTYHYRETTAWKSLSLEKITKVQGTWFWAPCCEGKRNPDKNMRALCSYSWNKTLNSAFFWLSSLVKVLKNRTRASFPFFLFPVSHSFMPHTVFEAHRGRRSISMVWRTVEGWRLTFQQFGLDRRCDLGTYGHLKFQPQPFGSGFPVQGFKQERNTQTFFFF